MGAELSTLSDRDFGPVLLNFGRSVRLQLETVDALRSSLRTMLCAFRFDVARAMKSRAAMSTDDAAPIVAQIANCWRVTTRRNGRVQVYRCPDERDARRFAELLSVEPFDPPGRRYSTLQPTSRGEPRIEVFKMPSDWVNGRD